MEEKRLPSVDLHEFPKESLLNRLTSFKKENVADQERLAWVVVLYTGGTIGTVTKNGAYEPQSNCMEDKLRSLPIFHDEKLAKKTLSPEDLKHFLALPAVAVNDLDTIKVWHMAGADLNSCDYDYHTPLHIAVSSERKDIIKYLVRGGARCNLQDVFGLTPRGIAQQLGHTKVIQMMSPGGALPAAMSIGMIPEDKQQNVNGRLVARVKSQQNETERIDLWSFIEKVKLKR